MNEACSTLVMWDAVSGLFPTYLCRGTKLKLSIVGLFGNSIDCIDQGVHVDAVRCLGRHVGEEKNAGNADTM